MAQQWFYVKGSKRKGPVSEETLRKIVRERGGETLVWKAGMGSWKPAREVFEQHPRIQGKKPANLPSADGSGKRRGFKLGTWATVVLFLGIVAGIGFVIKTEPAWFSEMITKYRPLSIPPEFEAHRDEIMGVAKSEDLSLGMYVEKQKVLLVTSLPEKINVTVTWKHESADIVRTQVVTLKRVGQTTVFENLPGGNYQVRAITERLPEKYGQAPKGATLLHGIPVLMAVNMIPVAGELPVTATEKTPEKMPLTPAVVSKDEQLKNFRQHLVTLESLYLDMKEEFKSVAALALPNRKKRLLKFQGDFESLLDQWSKSELKAAHGDAAVMFAPLEENWKKIIDLYDNQVKVLVKNKKVTVGGKAYEEIERTFRDLNQRYNPNPKRETKPKSKPLKKPKREALLPRDVRPKPWSN